MSQFASMVGRSQTNARKVILPRQMIDIPIKDITLKPDLTAPLSYMMYGNKALFHFCATIYSLLWVGAPV